MTKNTSVLCDTNWVREEIKLDESITEDLVIYIKYNTKCVLENLKSKSIKKLLKRYIQAIEDLRIDRLLALYKNKKINNYDTSLEIYYNGFIFLLKNVIKNKKLLKEILESDEFINLINEVCLDFFDEELLQIFKVNTVKKGKSQENKGKTNRQTSYNDTENYYINLERKLGYIPDLEEEGVICPYDL